MAYGKRKRLSRNSRRITARKVYRRKPTARNQQHQIARLARKVNKVSKTLSVARDWQIWSRSQANVPLTAPSSGVVRLIDPTNWDEKFISQTVPDDMKHNFKMTSLALDLMIEAATEPDLCTFTVYVFKLKKDVADRLVNTQNDLSTFSVDKDYINVNGMALLNRNKYDVLMCRRLFTEKHEDKGNEFRSVRGPHRIYKKFKIATLLKNTMDKWDNGLTTDKVPIDQRMYMIIFNDNASSLEGSPYFSYSSLITGYAF